MYSIKLANGNTLSSLELNGNNFIAATVLEDSIFDGGLGTVEISDGTATKTYTDMKLIANRVYGGKSWFILAEKTQQEKVADRLQAALSENANNITDLQIALVEVYEMMLGGM